MAGQAQPPVPAAPSSSVNACDAIDGIATALVCHKELIGVLSNVAGVLGLIVAAAALAFTGYQLMRSTRQARASRIYDIQKDSREIAAGLLSDKETAKIILGREIEQTDLAYAVIGRLFNFYAAVYQQKLHGTLDRQLWRPFEIELREFLESADAQTFWNEKKSTGQYDPRYVDLVERLRPAQSPATPSED